MSGGALSGSEFDAVLARKGEMGFRGLLKNPRSLLLALFASLGGVLYGYNPGRFEEFVHRYSSTMQDTNKTRLAMLTAILELGAFVGAFFAGPISDRYSRKYSISGWCGVFCIGVAVQVSATYDVGFIFAGRFIAGLGIGAISMLVPMFNAELSAPGIRGSLVALQQLAITVGIMISYWIGYGTNYIGGTTYPSQKSAAWRVPLAVQLVPAILLAVGACFIPFSPRWLMLRGREDECLKNLAYLRGKQPDSPEVQYEFRTLQAERLVEQEAARERYGKDEVTLAVAFLEYRRLLTSKPLLKRLAIGALAQTCQQWTGINAILYYAPTSFKGIGLTGSTVPLLATALVGIEMFIFTIPAVLFVDNFGRKPMLKLGALNMAIAHACVAAIVASFGGPEGQPFKNKAAGNGAVFLIFWYVAWFGVTWGPLAWVVSAAVFPLDMRAKGMSLSSGANWIMNFTVALTTPVMFQTVGWLTYVVFMVFCLCGLVFSYLIPELKGMSLEEIDTVFQDDSGAADRERRARIAQEIGLDKVAALIPHREGEGDEKGCGAGNLGDTEVHLN